MPRGHGACGHRSPQRRRMGDHPPVHRLRRTQSQPDRGRRPRTGLAFTCDASAGAPGLSAGLDSAHRSAAEARLTSPGSREAEQSFALEGRRTARTRNPFRDANVGVFPGGEKRSKTDCRNCRLLVWSMSAAAWLGRDGRCHPGHVLLRWVCSRRQMTGPHSARPARLCFA